MNRWNVLYTLTIVISNADQTSTSDAWLCNGGNCKATSAGADGKSCLFSEPLKVCLKSKTWRLLSKAEAAKFEAKRPYMGIGCWEGKAGSLRGDSGSEQDLAKDFSSEGYTGGKVQTNTPDCPPDEMPCPAKDDVCQSTPLGSDGKSCQFDKPVRMCLKDKAWRQVSVKDGKWAVTKKNAVGCRSGIGMALAQFGDSKEALSKSFKAGGYDGDEDTSAITEKCEPLSPEVAFSKDVPKDGWKSLEKLLAYFREQASPEVLKKVSEVVSKAISKQ